MGSHIFFLQKRAVINHHGSWLNTISFDSKNSYSVCIREMFLQENELFTKNFMNSPLAVCVHIIHYSFFKWKLHRINYFCFYHRRLYKVFHFRWADTNFIISNELALFSFKNLIVYSISTPIHVNYKYLSSKINGFRGIQNFQKKITLSKSSISLEVLKI